MNTFELNQIHYFDDACMCNGVWRVGGGGGVLELCWKVASVSMECDDASSFNSDKLH